jgi:hypothetical protein
MVSGFIQVLAKPLFVMDIGTIGATPYVFRSFVFQSHLLSIFMCMRQVHVIEDSVSDSIVCSNKNSLAVSHDYRDR